MLLSCFYRCQLALANSAHVGYDDFRVWLLVFVIVELMREEGSSGPKPGSANVFIVECSLTDPNFIVVITALFRAARRRQGVGGESSSKQVPVEVEK